MSELTHKIQQGVIEAVRARYGLELAPEQVVLQPTRKEFEGDYTLVVFPLTRLLRKKPEAIGEELGQWLCAQLEEVARYNVVKGFLNLVVADSYWNRFVRTQVDADTFGRLPASGQKIMVEYSSPNTNKPLHLGHIRNILLGWSLSQILEAAGHEVIKTQIVNDRGIAICRSMVAWKRWGQGATPESTGKKGDHLVGDFYVLFSRKFEEEYAAWQQTEEAERVFAERRKEGQTKEAFFKAFKNQYFNEFSELGAEARAMLRKWEAGDEETLRLWRMMNDWVLAGFEETYRKLGVSFDKTYFESDTYLLGKEIIEEGLAKGVFRRDGKRIWIDLSHIGLGEKTIIKSDGTSTYTSQDLGTARMRYEEFGFDRLIYVVGDEQISHFQGLFEILRLLGEPYAEGLFHLAYGMVDLPTGRMKSREGTVVDADDLIEEVIEEARRHARARGEIAELPAEQQEAIVRQIGMAALKFFIIKVNPRKRMTFDPGESVDMQGQTGPYVQNAYVRIRSVLRKAGDYAAARAAEYASLQEGERALVKSLYQYPEVVAAAAREYDPSLVANYAYQLARAYHKFYHDYPILKAESEPAKAFRLELSRMVARVLAQAMALLGIEMPERM